MGDYAPWPTVVHTVSGTTTFLPRLSDSFVTFHYAYHLQDIAIYSEAMQNYLHKRKISQLFDDMRIEAMGNLLQSMARRPSICACLILLLHCVMRITSRISLFIVKLCRIICISVRLASCLPV